MCWYTRAGHVVWSAGYAPYHAAEHSALFRTRPLLCVPYVLLTAVRLYVTGGSVGGLEDGLVVGWMGARVWVLEEVMGGLVYRSR